ncbi:DUF3367 domain-containing protein [Micromonospora sp. ATA32]|nr:DUF3367 domain-containing protein [Micromonospora sp. ATA32]
MRSGCVRWCSYRSSCSCWLCRAGLARSAAARPGLARLPPHWRAAATWLADRDALARTLVVPGTGFGQYEWGRTVDEPLQSLAGAPWAVRNQIPLGSAGNTRMMDTVESVLAHGQGSTGLADFLARSGFRHLLLRNDIERGQVDAPPVAVLRRALTDSPGIARVASFGTTAAVGRVPGSPVDDDAGALPAIEVYEVQRPVPAASAVLTADVPTVSGGPESLLPLLEQGLIERDRPVVLAGDRVRPDGQRWIVTDGLRRRERDIGRVRDNLSQTLTATEAGRQRRVALDLLPFRGMTHQTVATYQGLREITASSSASYVDNLAPSDPSHLPFAAVDGDGGTAWQSAPLAGPVGQWLQVDLDTPREVAQVSLAFVDDLGVGWPVTRFRLTTDRGSVDHDVAPTFGAHTYYTLPGATSTIRVTVLAVAGGRLDGGGRHPGPHRPGDHPAPGAAGADGPAQQPRQAGDLVVQPGFRAAPGVLPDRRAGQRIRRRGRRPAGRFRDTPRRRCHPLRPVPGPGR